MVRDFSEKKREELYGALDVIDNKEWKSFMTWCGGRAGEFGVWADRLGIPSYTSRIDDYQNRILEVNSSTRNQINIIFENVAHTDLMFAETFQKQAESLKEMIEWVRKMIGGMNGDESNELIDANKGDEFLSQREKMILSGREILMRHLEGEENIDPAEWEKICGIIEEKQSNMLINLYIADCYSGVDTDRIYEVIMDYYEKHKNDEKLDYAEDILRKYLIAQDIADVEEQQKIIDAVRANQPEMLMNLYVTNCYSSADSRLVEKAIMDYYNIHKMDITIDDVEGLEIDGQPLQQIQKETFVACWNYLFAMGLTKDQVIAVMANIYSEGELSPTNRQNTDDNYDIEDPDYVYLTDDNVGYGICQWTYHSRKEGLQNMANEMGKKVSDLDVQLAYFQLEMEKDFGTKWSDFLATRDREEAVVNFYRYIEIPETSFDVNSIAYKEEVARRVGFADDVADWYDEMFN